MISSLNVRRILWTAVLISLPVGAEAARKTGAPVRFSGSFRTRQDLWNWFGDDAGGNYTYSGNQVRLSVSHDRPGLRWEVEFLAPALLGLPVDSVLGAPRGALGVGGNYYAANRFQRNAGGFFAKQAYVRWSGKGQSLKFGRFEFNDGTEITAADPTVAAVKATRLSQRLVGSFGWTHVGRSMDGFQYTAGNNQRNFTLVAARPTRGVFQTDGWGNLDIVNVYASYTGQRKRGTVSEDWRVLSGYYHDYRRVVKTDNRPLAVRRGDLSNIRIGTFGGHYVAANKTRAGTLDGVAWGVVQTGRWGRIDHRGFAWMVEGGWQPEARWRPWLRMSYGSSSGDRDPDDGTHTTFFQLLPTPRPFARTPFYDLVNNRDLVGILVLRPSKAVTLRSEVHGLWLGERNDLWFQGGGAFQPWTFGYIGRPSGGKSELGQMYDASVDWSVNAKLAVTGYYGYTHAGGVIRATYPRKPNGQFGYVELLVRF
jgi:hypothetical protein